MKNKIIKKIIRDEYKRQNNGIELIASENYPSHDVYKAVGSILQAKYAEGYPGKRYYGGCENVDKSELYAIEQLKKLFKCNYANVQPHSGSQANAAAYYAMLPEGGKIMSLKLNDGGHITHTALSSVGNRNYTFVHYPLGEDGKLNYDAILKMAIEELPDVILCGYSAYPYIINFKAFNIIRKAVEDRSNKKCYLMVDMAHIAGLIAAGYHPSPFPYADIVTSTTHKTLRGPRGGIILTNDKDLATKIDSGIFPRSQGGPLEHVIAAKGICFAEDNTDTFKDYIRNVLINTKACNDMLAKLGDTVSGTENHLFLLNVYESYGITGLEAQTMLESIGITTNKNMLPNDRFKPNKTSGLRIGFAAITSRGCTKKIAEQIAIIIHNTLHNEWTIEKAKKEVKKVVRQLHNIPR